jgi:response regulator of citrate/malate metabolism
VTGQERAGAADYLIKPCDAQELWLHLRGWLMAERETLRRRLGEDLDR